MPTSLPGLIPLHATVRGAFNKPCGNVTSLFKKPWIHPPRPGNPAFPTRITSLPIPPCSQPLSNFNLCFSHGAPHSPPRHMHGHRTRQPSPKMPLYPVALALLPSSGLCSAGVHPYLQAWPLHSSSGLVTGFNKLLWIVVTSSKGSTISLPTRTHTETCRP